MYVKLSTLPTRDWNKNKSKISFSSCPTLSTLPTRDWNRGIELKAEEGKETFHSTYKGLKHSIGQIPTTIMKLSTLPTRDWNRLERICTITLTHPFHSTYKGLKLYTRDADGNCMLPLSTLPTRDWNGIKTVEVPLEVSLSTLPTRDWNVYSEWFKLIKANFPLYLQGIETSVTNSGF